MTVALPGAPPGEDKAVLNVEVCLRPDSAAELGAVRAAALQFITSLSSVRYAEGPLHPPPGQHPLLDAHVQSIRVVDLAPGRIPPGRLLLQWDVAWQVCVFALDSEGAADDDEGEDGTPAYREWVLPAAEFHGSWETLYYESEIKQRLLRYATSALLFSESRVNPQLISWNRVVLLHGPPGTGKTSLCQALAQKLTIRLGDKYPQGGVLVEVNAHSLFSKWFSESGKLVSRLFAKIQEVVDEPDTLVFVLIDEVESLTAARKGAVAGSEPADAIRAVNALLTRLDQLKAAPNVMVLTTSNITEAIDLAFVDRADIKAYIGNPNEQARYEILRGCIAELATAGIITDSHPLLSHPEAACLAEEPLAAAAGEAAAGEAAAYAAAEAAADGGSPGEAGAGGSCCMEEETESLQAQYLSRCLLEVARAADGFSGRTLRKLPFLAHASHDFPGGRCSCLQYVSALLAAVQAERADRATLSSGGHT
ncbi:pachytene checkpoint 2-like protein [Chlorella sorokiniana]|uniref:Pachytene checkpoint protein 2 homolog n=1 Tax=Chlorella sorokiniana TaxID=3076 RepID=A0A2P6TVL8_CHLSO|nr:pachytene checkpoint 2-like protein [Chlorella sorokiniana]|eukprot:PRW58109.1 pachytene checkpoint 2-like protein [Chlorella sorokiniana]